jgi:hypothetical protein
MKKIVLIHILLAGITRANAQSISPGIKAGINVSEFVGGGLGNNSTSIVGFHGGFFTHIRFSFISLQPEILVSTAGSKLKGINPSEGNKIVYLSIPLMMQIGKQTGIYAETGPQFSFRLNEVNNTIWVRFSGGFDFSLGMGVGYRTKSGLGIISRYLLGISNTGNYGDPGSFEFKNSVFQIGLSHKLKIK